MMNKLQISTRLTEVSFNSMECACDNLLCTRTELVKGLIGMTLTETINLGFAKEHSMFLGMVPTKRKIDNCTKSMSVDIDLYFAKLFNKTLKQRGFTKVTFFNDYFESLGIAHQSNTNKYITMLNDIKENIKMANALDRGSKPKPKRKKPAAKPNM